MEKKEVLVKVEFKGTIIDGILLNEDEKYLVVKLSSGYNSNLKKENIKIISKKEKIVTVKTLPINSNSKNLPNIVVLHTGGTIASKVDYETGAVNSKFTPEELLALYPELNNIANLFPEMIANLSSEDMRFGHWNKLLKSIENHINNNVDGIIISHGTDTMHYTSSALHYALKNLPCPILLVGAQRSSDRASSDAFLNLKAAVEFIVENSKKNKSYRRVGICMHNTISDEEFVILDGINTKKMHSSRRDAFKQINYNPYAIKKEKLEILRPDLETIKSEKKLKIVLYNEKLNIGIFYAHPNLNPKEIENLSFYDGLVIAGTGLGHIAVSEFDDLTKINKKNLEAIKNLLKTTKIVVGVQTVYGKTNMDIYSSGRHLKNTGVLGQHMSLILETLFSRIAHCLSSENFDETWSKNLEGFDMVNLDIS